MSGHPGVQRETVGFGAPGGIDPHCFEVHIPPGNAGDIRVVEHYGVAAGAFGRPDAERCLLTRKVWGAIREDLRRCFNERLREKNLAVGFWKPGVNKVERLLGQELLVLAWGVEAADTALIPVAVRNWLALRPEERWWLYAVTASSTGEVKHREIGWRKALRFALTENPVRESLTRVEPTPEIGLVKGRRKARVNEATPGPMLPGFEESRSPFATDATIMNGVHEDSHALPVLAERLSISDRASNSSSEDIGRSTKGTKGRSKSDAHGPGVVLEGAKAARACQGVRSQRITSRHR